MKIKYFQDTDTLYIEFHPMDVAETKDYDEDTYIDIDAKGNVCGFTIEHVKERANFRHFLLNK